MQRGEPLLTVDNVEHLFAVIVVTVEDNGPDPVITARSELANVVHKFRDVLSAPRVRPLIVRDAQPLVPQKLADLPHFDAWPVVLVASASPLEPVHGEILPDPDKPRHRSLQSGQNAESRSSSFTMPSSSRWSSAVVNASRSQSTAVCKSRHRWFGLNEDDESRRAACRDQSRF